MSIQDQITADQSALDAAIAKRDANVAMAQKAVEDFKASGQIEIDACQQQLDVDTAKLNAVAPFIALIEQVKSELNSAREKLDPAAQAAFDTIEAPILPILDQMEALANQ